MRIWNRRVAVLALLVLAASPSVWAEDGYDLWLRYPLISDASLLNRYRASAASLLVTGDSATIGVARAELTRGLRGLLGREIPPLRGDNSDGAIVAGTPATSPLIRGLNLAADLKQAGSEGFLIRSVLLNNRPATIIAGNTDVGVLYGAFHFLRMLQTHQRIDALAVVQSPRIRLRVLNHWDNLDGTVERGYAGGSLWDWHKLPDYRAPRYEDTRAPTRRWASTAPCSRM